MGTIKRIYRINKINRSLLDDLFSFNNYYKKSLIASLVIVSLILALAPFSESINYRSEITDYFSPDDDRLLDFLALRDEFSLESRALVLLDLKEGNWQKLSQLQLLQQITQKLEKISGIEDVESILQTPIAVQTGNGLETQTLNQILKGNKLAADEIENQLINYYWEPNFILSQHRNTTLLTLEFSSNLSLQQSAYEKLKSALRETSEENRLLSSHLLGDHEIKQELQRSLIHDALYLSPLVLICGLLILWIFHRSLTLVLAGATPIILTLILSLEITACSQLLINQTSILSFGVIFIIALADVIHLLSSYRLYATQGSDNFEAMKLSLQSNFAPLATTTITTMVGFLSFNFSPSPTFATFGNLSAMGIGLAFLVTLAVIPVLVVHIRVQESSPVDRFLHQLFIRISKPKIKPKTKSVRRAITVGFYIVALLLMTAVPLNEFHNDPLDYFASDSSLTSSYNTLRNSFGGQHTLALAVTAKNPEQSKGWIYSPSFIEEMNLLTHWLEQNSAIVVTDSYLKALKHSNQSLHDNQWKWHQVPTTEQALADQLLSYELLNEKQDLTALGINKDGSKAIITLNLRAMKSAEFIELERNITEWSEEHLTLLSLNLTGSPMLFAAIGNQLTQQMFVGAVYSVLIITLVIAITFRNLRVALLSLIPNVIPCAVFYGIWALSVGTIDIAAAGSLSICLGIVVDDTIHIIKRYTRSRTKGLSPDAAIEITYQQTGSALLLTTLVLSSGFSILTLSIFGPNATTSIVIASVVSLALLFDFILLPQLLRAFDPYLGLEKNLVTEGSGLLPLRYQQDEQADIKQPYNKEKVKHYQVG